MLLNVARAVPAALVLLRVWFDKLTFYVAFWACLAPGPDSLQDAAAQNPLKAQRNVRYAHTSSSIASKVRPGPKAQLSTGAPASAGVVAASSSCSTKSTVADDILP
jgi:hypothetical protein